MSYRRILVAVLSLALASLACSVNLGNSTSVPPTSVNGVPSKTPVGFHNGGVTPEAPTEEQQPTDEAPTKAPTRAPKPTATKAPTRAPKPTATEAQQQASCDSLQASGDVYWVTFDKNNNSTTVDSYPSGVTEINPAFDYDCNPQSVQIITVWTQDGQQIFSDKNNLDASDSQGTYVDGLKQSNGDPLPDGKYGVQFFNAKQVIASGDVQVGGGSGGNGNGNGGNSGGAGVTLQGTITDKATGKPIVGAVFIALKPGITADQFINTDNASDNDVYSAGQTDSSGDFTLPDQLQRGKSYSLLAFAKNYKLVFQDSYKVDDNTPDPDVWTVQLAK